MLVYQRVDAPSFVIMINMRVIPVQWGGSHQQPVVPIDLIDRKGPWPSLARFSSFGRSKEVRFSQFQSYSKGLLPSLVAEISVHLHVC